MVSLAVKVQRKEKESFDYLLRRFNKKVQQSGVISLARKKKFYERPLSKREKREIAIRKAIRKEIRNKRMMYGK